MTVPRDCFVLVRTDAGIGAFKLTEETDDGDGGVKYVWYFRPDADGGFLDPGSQKGESVVFEKYDRTRLSSGENLVEDMGGQLWIECGPIRLEWSSGDHVYFPADRSAEITCTSESEIGEVSVTDPELIWCGR